MESLNKYIWQVEDCQLYRSLDVQIEAFGSGELKFCSFDSMSEYLYQKIPWENVLKLAEKWVYTLSKYGKLSLS